MSLAFYIFSSDNSLPLSANGQDNKKQATVSNNVESRDLFLFVAQPPPTAPSWL
jgi:hypothetical protein